MKKEIWSVPNILSYVRILLIPFIVASYLTAKTDADYACAAVLVLLSGLTDCADGWIARRFHLVTELGKVIDPIADKLTQAAIALCLMLRYPLMRILVVVFVVKELTTGVLSLIQYKKGLKLNGAMWFGKVATIVFYIVALVLIAVPAIPEQAANALIALAMLLMLFAFARYVPEILRLSKQSDSAGEESGKHIG